MIGMAAQLIDGKVLSAAVKEKLRLQTEELKAAGVTPGLAVILVGEDPGSQIYVRNKEKACEQIGIHSIVLRLPESTTQQELEAHIRSFNEDETIDGILVQVPLPRHMDEAAALSLIRPDKDVDGFHVVSMGRLFGGMDTIVACTPKGVMEMIHSTGVSLSGKEAVVVGRSNNVGKPIAMLLLQENATVTMCHSRTRDLAAHTRRADILVAAVGKPKFITGDMVKPGAVVIDVGINRVDGKVIGDVDFESASQVADFISPVPGGVGLMTVAMLMANTLQIASARLAAKKA
jgi:methylenetetrahydrofolate dehydrogenase (NADP+) / methenyltetrahydrofolate cyclohydrolase